MRKSHFIGLTSVALLTLSSCIVMPERPISTQPQTPTATSEQPTIDPTSVPTGSSSFDPTNPSSSSTGVTPQPTSSSTTTATPVPSSSSTTTAPVPSSSATTTQTQTSSSSTTQPGDGRPVTHGEGTYYSSLQNNTQQGNDFKITLYNLIKNHTSEYNYDNLEAAMRITDRNWDLSPNINDENPFMYLLYMVDNSKTTPAAGKQHAHLWNTYNGSGGIIEDSTHKAVWDKEHMWVKSNGFPSKGAPAHYDLHHLRASDKLNNNVARNNRPYGSCPSGTVQKDYDGNNSGKYATTYEPIDRDKGECARAIFYMATRYYNGDGSSGTSLTLTDNTESSGGKYGYLTDLLKWNRDYPPSTFETYRNDIIYELGIQSNRNPFIDHPEYACRIWGTTSSSTRQICGM